MRKTLSFLVIAAVCLIVAFRYFDPDLPLISDASDEPTGAPSRISTGLYRTRCCLCCRAIGWIFPRTRVGWCSSFSGPRGVPGCADEVPNLIHLQQEFADQGFTVVAVAQDDEGEESVGSFVTKRRFDVNGDSVAINYPVMLGSKEAAVKLGFEGGLPAGVLVNREGREVKIVRGVVSEAALSKAIQKLVSTQMSGYVKLALMYFPEYPYEEVQPGVTFTVREGPLIVGYGVIQSRGKESFPLPLAKPQRV